jgi:hypothetical protein
LFDVRRLFALGGGGGTGVGFFFSAQPFLELDSSLFCFPFVGISSNHETERPLLWFEQDDRELSKLTLN